MTSVRARQPHLQCAPGEVGGYVLMPGDPGRVARIAALLDDAHSVTVNRDYETWTGTLAGVAVSVTSTGIGGPSAAIAAEELCSLGAHTLVRVGTSGGMQPGHAVGNLVIAQAAVRDEGTSAQYLPIAWPAVAHLDVVDALRDAAHARGAHWQAGVVHSKDSFYGQIEPSRMPVAEELRARWEAWVQAGVLASEMECAAVFTVAAVRRVRAGAIVILNAAPGAPPAPLDDLIGTAVDAVRLLIERDGPATAPADA